MPDKCVVGGYDIDNLSIYVGRASHEGQMLPAKVILGASYAYVCWGSKEYKKTSHYEILVGNDYEWMEIKDGSMPPNAVSTGKMPSGEPLYVGRGYHTMGEKQTLCVGRIQPLDRCLYIPFDCMEVRLYHYEVLIHKQQADLSATPKWAPSTSPPTIPHNAVLGGYALNDQKIYVGRAFHEGQLLPAKVMQSMVFALVGWNKCEYRKWNFEVLIGPGYKWEECADGNVPPNAVSTGKTRSGEPFYVGRGYHEVGEKQTLCVGRIQSSERCLYIPFGFKEERINSYQVLIYKQPDVPQTVTYGSSVNAGVSVPELKWVPCTSSIPSNAALVDPYNYGAEIYVGRAEHENEVLPAKVMAKNGRAYISFCGKEIEKSNFDVLVGHEYDWKKPDDHKIPKNAVYIGNAKNGKNIYYGRGSYKGVKMPGIVLEGEGCLYIACGREIRLGSYEVLCKKDKATRSARSDRHK